MLLLLLPGMTHLRHHLRAGQRAELDNLLLLLLLLLLLSQARHTSGIV
jgi:hypothetical protein